MKFALQRRGQIQHYLARSARRSAASPPEGPCRPRAAEPGYTARARLGGPPSPPRTGSTTAERGGCRVRWWRKVSGPEPPRQPQDQREGLPHAAASPRSRSRSSTRQRAERCCSSTWLIEIDPIASPPSRHDGEEQRVCPYAPLLRFRHQGSDRALRGPLRRPETPVEFNVSIQDLGKRPAIAKSAGSEW